MRKLLPYLGASLTTLAMVWSAPSHAQDQFKDLDSKHWAYEAVTDLQQKGIVQGYPGGYFKGKRTLSRYEFAIALKRALEYVGKQAHTPADGPVGPVGPQGPQGDAGPQGPSGMTPEEIASLHKLTDEFKDELKSLGVNAKDVNSRLDSLARTVAAINSRLDRQIHWSTDMFLGARTDLARTAFSDYSGAARTASNTILGAANVIHDLQIAASANLSGGARAVVDLCISNYPPYRGGTLTEAAVANEPLNPAGRTNSAEAFLPFAANVEVPLGGPKSNTTLTIGRFLHHVTPLTYWCPNLDTYFDMPWYESGNLVNDGIRLQSKVGSLGVNLWAASFGSIVGNFPGSTMGLPLFGATDARTFTRGTVPAGINVFGDQAAANQSLGLSLDVPAFRLGQLGVNLIYLTTNTQLSSYMDPIGNTGVLPYSAMIVYDANFKLKPIGRLNAYAEWAKSVTQTDIGAADGQSNDANNAYAVNFGYASGPLDVKAGYNYVDPNYAAPGAWDKIGTWYNPTNVRGPYVRVGFKCCDKVQLHLGGDFLTGARNRDYLTTGDDINRVVGGFSYQLNKVVGLTADYEGDLYRFTGGTKPIEQYITFGASAKVSNNTVLKLAYQILSYNQFSPLGAGLGNTANANVLTTQVAVHF